MPLVTAAVAAPLILLIAALGLAVTRKRMKYRVSATMTGDASFVRFQRVHANAVEHVPIVLIGLLLLELSGASKSFVGGLGGMLIFARICHATGLSQRTRHPLQIVGAGLTYMTEIVVGVSLAWIFLRSR